MMAIEFPCECGRTLRATEASVGRRGRCPTCGAVFTVPTLDVESPVEEPLAFAVGNSADDGAEGGAGIPLAAKAPMGHRSRSVFMQGPRAAVADVMPKARPEPMSLPSTGSKSRGYLYLVLLVVLLPLAWSTVHGKDNEFNDNLKLTMEHHPELREKLLELIQSEEATEEEIFAAIPADKLDGALLAKHTYAHWVFAGVSGAAFIGMVLALFPWGHAKAHTLVLIGVFTGTAGIILLLGLQWLAFRMPLFNGRGWITLLLDLVWLIGQSYKMALGDHGFVLSFLGFTAGVGFCEEACKALPLLVRARRGISSWRTAMLWGLLSGVGFGVSEGITYSSDYYNGISGPPIYLVRFISCVGLHAIWSAAVGITIYRKQEVFEGGMHPLLWIVRTLQVVIVPMILHGLYDTLLKQKFEPYALLVALVSFGWLAFQIEWAKRSFDKDAAPA